jgi:hypothetical protein
MWKSAIFEIKSADPNWKLVTDQYGFVTACCISSISYGLAHSSSNYNVWLTP